MDNNKEITTLYCELLTNDDIAEFEELMVYYGYSEMDRPAKWAERKPHWMEAGLPRGENDDPLAAVILNLYHNEDKHKIYSAFRCKDGEKISKEMMKNFICTACYNRIYNM